VQEYSREHVTVQLLESGESVPAEVYIWTAPLSRLSPTLWSFAEFMKDKAHRWVGSDASDEYAEVDRRRAMAGVITPPVVAEENGFKEFGRSLRESDFAFEPGWVPLNHGSPFIFFTPKNSISRNAMAGSYGAAPRFVIKAFRDVQDRSMASPDRFIKQEYGGELALLRERLSRFVGCGPNDLVL
jgi:hypothetical protein